MLYLKIKKLNEINNKRIGENDRADLLINKYYILTNSLRIHYCAKSLNLNANVLCKPQSLMAYLSETGSNNTSEIRITSLFDNIFLLHTSKLVWEDIKTLGVLISFDKFVKHDLDECNLYHSFCSFSKEFIIDGQPSEVFQP